MYRGSALPASFQGRYFYGIFASIPEIIAADRSALTDPNPNINIVLASTLGMTTPGPTAFITTAQPNEAYSFVGFGEDSDGEIYFLRVNSEPIGGTLTVLNNGSVFKLIP